MAQPWGNHSSKLEGKRQISGLNVQPFPANMSASEVETMVNSPYWTPKKQGVSIIFHRTFRIKNGAWSPIKTTTPRYPEVRKWLGGSSKVLPFALTSTCQARPSKLLPAWQSTNIQKSNQHTHHRSLMVFGGVWWLLMVFDGFWWLLMVFDHQPYTNQKI